MALTEKAQPSSTTSTIITSASSDHTSSASDHGLPSKEASDGLPYHDTFRSWIVAIAASVNLFMYMGIIYAWGVLQTKIADSRGYSLTTLTFVGSLATSFMVSLCILVGHLVRRFGYREVALAGAVFLGLGEILSSWVVGHLWALFITHGILFGVGGGLITLPIATAPLQWFRKYRGLATGIVFGSGSLGAAVMTVVTHELVDKVGVEWTFRVLGIMLWVVCIPAAWCIRQPLLAKTSIPQLQWSRLREPKCIILLLGGAVGCFPLFVPPYFIPVFARSVSSSASTGLIALTVWNLASAFGRVFAGYSADSLLGPMNSMVVSLFLSGVSGLCIWPFVDSLGLLVFFAIVNGIGSGSFFSLFPLTVTATFGATNVMGILPIMWQAWMFGYFLGTPVAAGLYSLSANGSDVASNRPAAYYAGAVCFVGMSFMLAIRFMNNKNILTRA
ncbi:related to protein MCH2 (monocarboxylate permease homolog) [Claviceps purpurea 20.1]|uniref:Related to protein MCH2 (Monocarboxylate permease homolog) n=1 Tax=Claviceps purpurea (strain 20.1) TaxID=1111077 RepID=M1WGV8_CLAP2|nr:related to protein MCH2 (monocarboxylate permease homolog) [Claviceps purpurea 20.1]